MRSLDRPADDHPATDRPVAGSLAARQECVLLGVLTLAALALRLFRLTHFEIWADEGATWYFARLIAAGHLTEQLVVEPTPPFYYGLVGLLMRLFGESDAVMRLPSAILGAAAVPAVHLLGRELWSRRAGLLAAVIVTLHPLHLFYSREARVYPLLMLLATLLFLTLWRALQSGERRLQMLFAAFLLLACYSHLFGLFLGVTVGLQILFWSRGRIRLHALAAAAVAGLLFAPYLGWILPHLEASGAAWSVEVFYERHPEEWRFGRILELTWLGAQYHPFLRQIAQPPTPPLLRAACLLAQVLLVAVAVLVAFASARMRQLGFLTVAWLVPLLVPWAIHHGRPFFHPGRHDFYILGPAVVLLAIGFDVLLSWSGSRGSGSWIRGAVVLSMAAVLLVGAGHRWFWLHRHPPTETHRQTGAWLARHTTNEDRIIALGIRRLRAEHYTRLHGSPAAFESFPASTDAHPGWSDDLTLLEDEAELHRRARERVAELERELAPEATLFVLLRNYPRAEGMLANSWLVDRHLIENLMVAGWRRVTALENEETRIQAYRPSRGGDA